MLRCASAVVLLIVCVLILASVLGCVLVNAQQGLSVDGPSNVFEEETVWFTVTSAGKPVQARVVFERDPLVKYSNASTGLVFFIMPHVGPDGEWFTITTSTLDGSKSGLLDIFVKNSSGRLTLVLPMEPVEEVEDFTVFVTDGLLPISDASVWFLSSVFLTNASGCVVLSAPDVLVTTSYGVVVNKTGFSSVSSMLTVEEHGVGERLMEVIAPSFVEPGQQDILVRVITAGGGLADVEVTLWYEGQNYLQNVTDSAGETRLTSPQVNQDTEFSLAVSKEGYRTFDDDMIPVHLVTRDAVKSLRIQPDSSEVAEGSLLLLTVTDTTGSAVEGVSIWKGDQEVDEKTDAEGILTITVPYVFMDREYYLYATKSGYAFGEKIITIRDLETVEKSLRVTVNATVNESTVFTVWVTDVSGVPVSDAVVGFYLMQKVSGVNGTVWFTAPLVVNDTFFSLDVTKAGFVPATAYIAVVDRGVVNESLVLRIYVTPRVAEDEEFVVTIRDTNEYPVANARVSFSGVTRVTDYRGVVTFTTPGVSWDSSVDVLVTKTGFLSASTTVLVVDTAGFPYWFLVIAVSVILIIGLVAYIWYRQYLV
ncbi:MAG: hypothetical protein V1726_06760 [Methanobacteriota archaeon]